MARSLLSVSTHWPTKTLSALILTNDIRRFVVVRALRTTFARAGAVAIVRVANDERNALCMPIARVVHGEQSAQLSHDEPGRVGNQAQYVQRVRTHGLMDTEAYRLVIGPGKL